MTLKTPAFNDAKPYGFEWWRLAAEVGGLQEGVIGPNDHKVYPAGAGGMRVDIAAGVALVKVDSGTAQTGAGQGLYTVVNDATVANAVTLAGSHASMPRVDRIYLRVNDSSDLGSASDTGEYLVLTGTPFSGATLDNQMGAQTATLADADLFADVLVPAGSTAVAAGNIRDRRGWARGALLDIADFSQNPVYSAASSSYVGIGPTYRLETSGRPVTMTIDCAVNSNTANAMVGVSMLIDGAVVPGGGSSFPNSAGGTRTIDTTVNYSYHRTLRAGLAAGSHVFQFAAAANSGTAYVNANNAQLLGAQIREAPTLSASN